MAFRLPCCTSDRMPPVCVQSLDGQQREARLLQERERQELTRRTELAEKQVRRRPAVGSHKC